MEIQRKPFDLTDRTILLTGGSSGIGRATAVMLSHLGARVIVSGRRPQQLEMTLELMRPGGHAMEVFDLDQLEAISDWVRSLAGRYGPFDGLVHSAGISNIVGLRALTVDGLHQTFRVNFHSAAMLAAGFRQAGCCNRLASIVFIGSIRALFGAPGTAAYASSKAALIGLTTNLATECAPDRIRVNCIAPGYVQSEMLDQIRSTLNEEQFSRIVAEHPLGLGTPADVAGAAAYLLSDASRWMTGQTLVLDGGFSAR